MGWLAGAVLAVGCGRELRHEPAVDARWIDGDAADGRDGDAADLREAAGACASAGDAAIRVDDMGMGWCGGEVALSGMTPLGAFCPTRVRADVTMGDCARSLDVTLADEGGDRSGLQLSLFLLYDRARGPWSGSYQVMAQLAMTGRPFTSMSFPATVEVTASDDPFVGDGGLVSGADPPVGAIHLGFVMETPAGVVTGSVIARYCAWRLCI